MSRVRKPEKGGRVISSSFEIKERLEYLRQQIENETISYAELFELQSLAEHIDKDDVELLQWAGVPEFGDEE